MDKIDKFHALSAPVRREIVALLSEGNPLTATAIAKKFDVSPSAVSQHLKVLLESDIVDVQKQAQQRIYSLNTFAIKELESWARNITTQLDTAIGAVDKHFGTEADKEAEA